MNYFIILVGLTNSIFSSIDISSDNTGNVFMDNEPVQFRIETSVDGRLSITDYDGKRVFEKDLSAGKSEVQIGELSRSHYTITVRNGDEVKEAYFAVIPSTEKRPNLEDPNIASDLATSWLVRPERFDDLAKLTKLAGIIWVRDRMSWGEIEAQRGNWAQHNRYDLSAEAQVKHGLKVYQVFHDTPGWAQKDRVSRSFPDDLRDMYNFAAEMARRFKGKVAAWEVWNEPDIIQFSDELGDSYSALLKAMYLGFKSADPELPVLICSFAMGPGKFAETIFQNDVRNYFDIYNYHIYDKWENHAGRALKHIEIMRRYGLEGKPIWLTEAGHAVKRLPDLVELTPEQGREVAEFLPKAVINSLAAGVDKYFWFIMPYYRESDVMLFGLLRGDMTPTAGYCAMAACTYALGKADYLGKLDLADIHAHAFRRDNDTIAVSFWTGELKKSFKLHADVEKATLIDLMGSEQEVKSHDGALELEAMPSVNYVILPANTLKDSLKIDFTGEKSGIKPYDPSSVSPLILRLQFPRVLRDKKAETYVLPGGPPTNVSIEVYNFGKGNFSGNLTLQLPSGWKGILDDGSISIEPMERVTRQLELSPDAEEGVKPGQIRIDLLNLSGNAETFIIASIAAKSG